MKRKGFTLVELLAVIILLGILIAIAVPSALSMSAKVKEKSYLTKIDLIEQAGITYGQANLNYVKRGVSLTNSSKDGNFCKLTYDEAGEKITAVEYNQKTSYAENELADNEFWCIQVPIKTLVETNNLDWDEKNVCDNCGDEYKNIVTNPTSDYIINECNVYVYYKYTRVYSYFDKTTCDKKTENYSEAKGNGREYRRFSENITTKDR